MNIEKLLYPVSKGYKRALTLLMMSLAMTSAVAYDFEVVNNEGVTIYYSYYGKSSVSVDRYSDQGVGVISYSGNVAIPATVLYEGKTYTVEHITSQAFSGCYNLENVTIPSTVRNIDYNAFENCTGLRSITIPSSVENIGNCAFYRLKNCIVTFERPKPPYGPTAFNGCSGCKFRVPAASVDQYVSYLGLRRSDIIPIMTSDPHITVAGVQVTEENLLDVLGDGGSVKYDGVGRLTLTNVYIEGDLSTSNGTDILDIEVNGNCYVTGHVGLGNPAAFVGSGTLDVADLFSFTYGECTVNGPTIDCKKYFRGYRLKSPLNVKKGTVKAAKGITEIKDLLLGTGIAIQSPAGGTFDKSQFCIVDANGNLASDVVIGGLTNDLKIYVGDELVTATNMNDVLHDGGSVKYDGVGKLTLNNATISGTDYALRTRVSKPLEIEVIGNCTLKSTTAGSSTGPNTMALATNTTFTGTGQLAANKGINVYSAAFTVDGPYVRCNDDLQGCQGGETLTVKSGKLYARIIQGFKSLTMGEGIVITIPEGGYYDTGTQRALKADGTLATGVQVSPGTAYVEATGISLNETSLTLTAIGATATLQPAFTPADATNRTVTWTTSNEYVATVSSKGKVTAKSQGTATITVRTASGLEATCEVTVNTTVVAQSLTLNKQELELRILDDGYYCESQKLVPVFSPADVTDKSVEWTVADPSVVSVDNSGRVEAKSIGETTVTCRAKDGSGLEATCAVTVTGAYTEGYGSFTVTIREEDYLQLTCHVTDRVNSLCEVSVSTFVIDPETSEPSFDRAIMQDTEGEITIPGEVTDWEDNTYQVTHIGDYAFDDCQGVTSFSLPEGLLTIGSEAFDGCVHLETVYLPSTLVSIDAYGFAGCASLANVYLPATTPPEVGQGGFGGSWWDPSQNPTRVLHVPAASLKLYREQAWTAWFDQIVPIDPVEGDLDGDGELTFYDAELITDYLLGKAPVDFDADAADFNHDGVVNIVDVTAVIQAIVE